MSSWDASDERSPRRPNTDSSKKTSVAAQRNGGIDASRPPSRPESGQQGSHEQQCRRKRQRNRVGASNSIQLSLQRVARHPRQDQPYDRAPPARGRGWKIHRRTAARSGQDAQ